MPDNIGQDRTLIDVPTIFYVEDIQHNVEKSKRFLVNNISKTCFILINKIGQN